MADPDAPSNPTRNALEHEIGEESSLLDVLIFLARHRKLLLLLPLAAAIAAAGISLLIPNIYAGTTKILPPQAGQTASAMLLTQLGGLAGLAGSSLGIKNPNDLYVGILKSRTVADKLIERFGLQQLYDQKTRQETRRALEKRTSIAHGRDGIITIQFEDEDPKRAASVANGYVEELYALTQALAVTEAGQRRLFFEEQLKLTKEALADAEVALKRTQETTGLIKLDEQGRAIIEAVAGLRAQITAKEVQAGAMRAFATQSNPDYARVQREIAGLKAELVRLERTNRLGEGDIFIPTGKVPEAGLEYIRRLRDIKYYETVFELLARQFEIAKIDEAREASIVQVLDPAVVPERKSGPHRTRIVIVTAILGFLAALMLAFLRDTRERARADPEQSRKLELLAALFRRR
jgi:tyrosine-protein kinase Etk/Wzc